MNVATGARYQRGQKRLLLALEKVLGNGEELHLQPWGNIGLPTAWPTHQDKPYAFKAYALKRAEAEGAELLLWCDASILPLRSLEPLWERIERDGYWFSDNGYSNYTWTADSAYPDLFPTIFGLTIDQMREANRGIKHVVATAFGLNLKHPTGKAFLDEYYRLASQTRAFCGPWWNRNNPVEAARLPNPGSPVCWPCGPPDVRGHRHDQTAASVIAWRLGLELTQPPSWLSYRGREDESTILCVDGNF